jgi:hypothetical protein
LKSLRSSASGRKKKGSILAKAHPPKKKRCPPLTNTITLFGFIPKHM